MWEIKACGRSKVRKESNQKEKTEVRAGNISEPLAAFISFLQSSCLFSGWWICFSSDETERGERAAHQIEWEREWGGGREKASRFLLTSNNRTAGANQLPIFYTNSNHFCWGERKVAYQGAAAEHLTSSEVFHLRDEVDLKKINPRAVCIQVSSKTFKRVSVQEKVFIL